MRFFLYMLIFCTFLQNGFAQDKLKVVLKNGTSVEYALDDIDCLKLDVEGDDESKTDTIAGLGGVVASPVDLGLSIKWASHNAGASNNYGLGALLTCDGGVDAALLWSDGWRLPTKDEWEELLDGTTAEWTVYNGVPGRKFTSSNGNSIFLPFVGFALASGETSGSNARFSTGAVGIYWSATADDSFDAANKGLYLDSGNLFIMEFSRTLRCGVRLVKD